jgi:nucleoid-associated protein YgaU
MRRPIVVALCSAIGVLILLPLGAGELGAPPIASPAELSSWLEQRDPVVAGFAVLRVAALAAGLYIVLLAALHAATSAVGYRPLSRFVERLTVPTLRRALTSAAGVGISSAVVLGAITPAGADPPTTSSDRMVELSTSSGPAISEVATMSVIDDAQIPNAGTRAVATPAAAVVDTTWTVEPGDSLWSIAEEHLADAGGAVVDERQVAVYWRSLIEANRAALLVPGDPNLIFPGQLLSLPPVT